MRAKIYVLIAALSFLGLTTASVNGQQIDLSMRLALYTTGQKIDKIDLAHDKYVAAGKTISISQNAATKCESDGCYFNVGIIAWRTSNGKEAKTGDLSTYGLFEFNGSLAGNTIFFHDGESIVQFVQSIKLKLGDNKVTFKIDPYDKTPESDETNNSFSVTIRVVPKILVRPKPSRK